MEHSTGSPLRLAIMRRRVSGEEPSRRAQRVDELYRRSASLAYLFSGAGDRGHEYGKLDRLDEEDTGKLESHLPFESTYSMEPHRNSPPISESTYSVKPRTGTGTRPMRHARRKSPEKRAEERLLWVRKTELARKVVQTKSSFAEVKEPSLLPKEEPPKPRPCPLLSLPIDILQIISDRLIQAENNLKRTQISGQQCNANRDLGSLRLTCRALKSALFFPWSSSIQLLSLGRPSSNQAHRTAYILRTHPEILGNIKGLGLYYELSWNVEFIRRILEAIGKGPQPLNSLVLIPENCTHVPPYSLTDKPKSSLLEVLLNHLPNTKALKLRTGNLPSTILEQLLNRAPACRHLDLVVRTYTKELFQALSSLENIENFKMGGGFGPQMEWLEQNKTKQRTWRAGGRIQMYRICKSEVWAYGALAVKEACEKFAGLLEEREKLEQGN